MKEKLTGNIRYRILYPLFKSPLVVLQVETSWEDGPDDWNGMPEYLSGVGYRDAKPEDLQYFQSIKK